MRDVRARVVFCGLAAALCVANRVARADTVYVATPFNKTYHVILNANPGGDGTKHTDPTAGLGAGDFQNSTVTAPTFTGSNAAVALPLYCVDIPDGFNPKPPATFSAAINTTGVIYNDNSYFNGVAHRFDATPVPNAAEIDYLMNKWGNTGVHAGAPTETELQTQAELQIALWRLIYQGNLTLSTSTHLSAADYGTSPGDGTPGVQSMLNDAAGHVQDSLLNNVVWINTYTTDAKGVIHYDQGLIGLLPELPPPPNHVPVPGGLVLLCTGLASFGGIGWMNKRRLVKVAVV
jgi:hypothetical protein